MKRFLYVLMLCTLISCSTDRIEDAFSITPNCTNGRYINVFLGTDNCSGESSSFEISLEESLRIRDYLDDFNLDDCVPVTVSPINPNDEDIDGYAKVATFDLCTIGM
jgi:hypothetical protein